MRSKSEAAMVKQVFALSAALACFAFVLLQWGPATGQRSAERIVELRCNLGNITSPTDYRIYRNQEAVYCDLYCPVLVAQDEGPLRATAVIPPERFRRIECSLRADAEQDNREGSLSWLKPARLHPPPRVTVRYASGRTQSVTLRESYEPIVSSVAEILGPLQNERKKVQLEALRAH